MSAHRTVKRLAHLARVGFTTVALFQFSRGAALAEAANDKNETADKLEKSTKLKVPSDLSSSSSAKIVRSITSSPPTSPSTARKWTICSPRASSKRMFNTAFTIPPVNQHSIADVLLEAGVSSKYYGDQWNAYLGDKYQLNYEGPLVRRATSTATSATVSVSDADHDRSQRPRWHLRDTIDFYSDVKAGTLPAVSWVKLSGWVDGHPASSKVDLFEGFVKRIVDEVRANRELWESTAIFITVDEGGGYYDSGYVQPLDFIGDGTRIIMIAVSPYTEAGHISHTYTDHTSTIKFSERNWNLGTISDRSRDNLPNPKPVEFRVR